MRVIFALQVKDGESRFQEMADAVTRTGEGDGHAVRLPEKRRAIAVGLLENPVGCRTGAVENG